MDSGKESDRLERWRRVLAIADRALELDGEERAAFVERCALAEPALGEELQALLASADEPSPIDSNAATFAAPLLAALTPALHAPPPESRFGAYRILRELGRGGMGAVYLAERADDQYRKHVALKLPPPWIAADARRVQRFVDERQILASLDHPDIARLIDGGVTADGLPWFAMEFVDGVPIDRYCDDHRLTIEARLELFCRVCSAVQYAHRNLVVHRDLKPSNILVAADGDVKLLDFGIAKLLADGAVARDVTITGERILTPLYASPEQLRGEPVSTAADVYALGVLLDVLLTGRDPYRVSTTEPHEVARAVLERDPVRPSLSVVRGDASRHVDALAATPDEIAAARDATPARLARRLRGDLDAIVLRAMEKEPARRYGSAEQFERDVRRHLAGLPVDARVGGRAYHARKFLRRHRVGVAVATGIAVLVLGFAVVTTVQSARIRAQAERITRERDRTEALDRYLMNILQQAVPSPGADRGVTAREVLDSAASRVEHDLAAQPEVRAIAMTRMARDYDELGEPRRARQLLEGARTLQRRLSPTGSQELAETMSLLGAVQLEQGEAAYAERSYREALAIYRRVAGPRHGEVARALNGLADALRAQGRSGDAEAASLEAVAIDSISGGRAALAHSLRGLADAHLDRGRYAQADPLYRRALSLLRDDVPGERREVAATLFGLAAARRGEGQLSAADSLVRRGLATYRRMAAVAPAVESRAALTVDPRAVQPGGAAPQDTSARASDPPHAGSRAVGDATPAAPTSRIAFVSDRESPDPIGDLGKHVLYVMSPDGTTQRRVDGTEGIGGRPAWSPDGRRIAFGRQRGTELEIFIVGVDGGDPVRLTNMAAELGARAPAWSPDGRRVAFESYVQPDIYVINADGTGLAKLTSHPERDFQPAWSPDGEKIAFVSDRDGNPEIYVMNADGSQPIRLTTNEAQDLGPSWSPDGKRIAFVSERDGDREIYVMAADGSNPTRLTTNPGVDAVPSWSPDGRRIVFHRRVLGHAQIFLMNADGSDVTRLTELSTTSFNGFPTWGPAVRSAERRR